MEKINLTFTEDHKYRVEFHPVDFWMDFALSYAALPWEERSEKGLSLVAVNYSYLLNILIMARDYYSRVSI